MRDRERQRERGREGRERDNYRGRAERHGVTVEKKSKIWTDNMYYYNKSLPP